MFRLLVAVSLVVSVAACKSEPPAEPAAQPVAEKTAVEPVDIDPALLAIFAPLPEVMEAAGREITDERVHLGKMLYFEERLSKNHDVSCNTCHGLGAYGVDNLPTSPGHKGALGARNSPTVYNAALHAMQFWDGRAADVEEQATGPIMNPVEMAMSDEKQVVATLSSMPEYVEAFEKSFPGVDSPITLENVGVAIGAFERNLVTPSRWDAYLAGDKNALTPEEKDGFKSFVSNGCITCHTGAGVGGHMMQKLGLVNAWPNDKDPGRFEVTEVETDRMFFKVPSLRNILKTGPYFHDGSVESIETAVKMMGRHQVGREITSTDIDKIVTFLGALTGELPPAEFIARPPLPASTKTTPKPDPA